MSFNLDRSWSTGCLQGDKLFDSANQTATEAFSSIRTVAAFSLAKPLSTLYGDLLKAPTKVGARRAHVNGLGFGFSQFIIFAVYALAFWYGAKLVADGTMDLGQLLKVGWPSICVPGHIFLCWIIEQQEGHAPCQGERFCTASQSDMHALCRVYLVIVACT